MHALRHLNIAMHFASILSFLFCLLPDYPIMHALTLAHRNASTDELIMDT